MSNRETMQQALKCIERCNMHGWILADFEDEVYAAISALKAALEQPEQRKWVGLTEFQFAEIYNAWNDTNGSTPWGLNQALEAKLRKLNK